jgi:diguanylate cyclase (GGDEF)-like protein/PAS domain S-box-containing protein
MNQLKTAIRLALCVGLVASAAVWVALSVGVLDNPNEHKARHRVTVARYVAIFASSLINSQREAQLQTSMEQFVASEPTLISIGIRTGRGRLVSAGPHESMWNPPTVTSSVGSSAGRQPQQELAPNQVAAELLANGRHYGTIEMVFDCQGSSIWNLLFGFPVPLATFMGGFVALIAWAIFERSFKYLDPSQVVPDRVRSALDTMAEGVVLLDTSTEIGHANGVFGEIVGIKPPELLGTKIDDFEWSQSTDFGSSLLPWSQALEEQRPICGVVVNLTLCGQPTRKFMVNASPIVSNSDDCKGVLVSLEDVTAMENKKRELSQMIATLRRSRDEVERQNVKLNFLASYDQLTECLNRREFFKRFEETWADEAVEDLAVIMLDIDHFKSVNDNHGHGKGDEILREMGRLLRECVGEKGIVARMGGEEFVAMLPNTTIGPATLVGEDIRQAVCADEIGGLAITASIGVSSRELLPMDTQHLLDQADQALYTAKNNGRNQVVRFDEREEVESNRAAQSLSAVSEPVATATDDQPEAIMKEIESLIDITSNQSESEPESQVHQSKVRSVPR